MDDCGVTGMEETRSCLGNGCALITPYIHCMECDHQKVYLCLRCFARGLDIGLHRSDHCYEVVRNDFSIFESNWTASSELKLLDAVAECGEGNWGDVSARVGGKTRQQCQRHYTKYYLESPVPSLPTMPLPDVTHHPTPVALRLCEDPPRPADGSTLQMDMSGYSPARGDFTVEHDNYAEMDLRDMNFSATDTPLEKELKFSVLDIYYNVLKERHRRKKLIRDHGLINIKKHYVHLRRYENTVGIHQAEVMRVFCTLLPAEKYEAYLEGLCYEAELRSRTRKLQEHRSAGLTKHHMVRIYEVLKKRRDEETERRTFLNDVLQHSHATTMAQHWAQKQQVLDNLCKGVPVPTSIQPRRNAPPLDIVDLPGYDRLLDSEKQLCSLVRLVPESYGDFKTILVTECRKQGYLRLAQARTMIKIDVNKTRKIFDFLLEQGFINKEPVP